jgi:glucose/arabinose dehydrogenase
MRRALSSVVFLALALAGCGEDPLTGIQPRTPATESGHAATFALARIADGLNRPTWVGTAPGDPDALWVLEQPGRVVRLEDGRRETLLDLHGGITTGAEQGLLGIAFDPDFAVNRRLYLHWTDGEGDTRVAEFRMTHDGDAIRPRPVRVLLRLEQPEENHNGGQLAFGPDERLYLGLGDGGGAFDPRRTAQDQSNFLGKVLALDVEAAEPQWQVVLSGLRNPWRFSFDPALGELWIGDVGQDEVEEVNRLLLELDEPPKNLGWSAYEGDRPVTKHGEHELDRTGDVVWPVAQYTHEVGCSVTGGYVYRGTRLPRLAGRYLYGDFCRGTLWTLRPTPGGRADDVRRERAAVAQLTHIGPDADGEPLFASAAGAIFRAVAP